MDDMIEIAGEEDLFSPPDQPTEAVVKIRRNENGEHLITVGDYKPTSKFAGKRWMRLPFVVVGGPYNNRYATLFLTLDGKDTRFRKAYQVATGADGETMKAKQNVSLSELIDIFASSTFLAVIQRETSWDKVAKERVPTDKTEVARLIRKLDEDEVPAAPADDEDFFGVGGGSEATAAEPEDGADDDMPF